MKIFRIVIVLILIVSVFIIANHKSKQNNDIDFPAEEEELLTSYENSIYGISFEYPEGYVLRESEFLNNQTKQLLSVSMISKDDNEERKDSELPISVSVKIFENSSDLSLEEWLNDSDSNEQSNFNLISGEKNEINLDGENAIEYRWSGLYEGKTTVLKHNKNIVLISVEYISSRDKILDVYDSVILSLDLRSQMIPERI